MTDTARRRWQVLESRHDNYSTLIVARNTPVFKNRSVASILTAEYADCYTSKRRYEDPARLPAKGGLTGGACAHSEPLGGSRCLVLRPAQRPGRPLEAAEIR